SFYLTATCYKNEIIPELFATVYETPIDVNVIKEVKDICTFNLPAGVVSEDYEVEPGDGEDTGGSEQENETNRLGNSIIRSPRTYHELFSMLGEHYVSRWHNNKKERIWNKVPTFT